MRFGLLYHHQVPRPWTDDSEEKVLTDSLEQVELADRLGFDYVWATEHHFMEEYSHSSAPEVFLAAAAARTRDIRLAHGIVSIPSAVNHPARVAERVSTLDLISGGRVDFGSGQGSTQLEVGAFGVDRESKREQWRDAIGVITRMMTEVPFTGHDSEWITMPSRNVVPKPKQKPHPPLWVACSSPETVETAARNGMGALSFSFNSLEETAARVEKYYSVLASEECVPAGFAVNPNFAVVLPFMCHEDAETAYDRGIDGAHWFAYSFMHYYIAGQHRPGISDLAAEFPENREMFGFVRHMDLAVKEQLDPFMRGRLEALERCLGTPEQLAQVVRDYESVGVDQIIFQAQIGTNGHEHICEALELFARDVMPEFTARRDIVDSAKQDRIAIAVKEATARIPVPEPVLSEYVIGAEMEGWVDPDDD